MNDFIILTGQLTGVIKNIFASVLMSCRTNDNEKLAVYGSFAYLKREEEKERGEKY